jgi:hypothetical protein
MASGVILEEEIKHRLGINTTYFPRKEIDEEK